MKKVDSYAGCAKAGLLIAGIALAGTLNARPLHSYNVLVADSQATVYSVDPRTGEKSIVAQGEYLSRPYDLALKRDGTIVVSDTATLRLVGINPATGEQSVLAEGEPLGVPFGIDVDRYNRIYVANS